MSVSSPFSTTDWVRRDLPSITVDDFSNDDITKAIGDGDKAVVDDLNKMIDFSVIDTIPEAVKRLSHYKACELVLLRVINNAGVISDENSLVNYWNKKYRDLLNDIRSEDVRLLDSSYDEYEADEVTKTQRVGNII